MEKRRAAAAVILCTVVKKRRKRNRKIWVQEWIQRRGELGAYHRLLNELRDEDPKAYKNFARMVYEDFEYLLEKVSPLIKKEDTKMRSAITPGERLSLTLRFLASGDSYHSLSYLFRIPVSTISTIIPECCEAIFQVLKNEYLKIPETVGDWEKISQEFENQWNFPNAIGALDGKHIVIQAPLKSGSRYYNYKGTFSIVLMALVDAKYNFIYIDVGCNGRVSDGGVFDNCSLSSALAGETLNIPGPKPLPGRTKPVPHVIIADDAFAMKPYLMKPFPYRNQPGPNRVYNYRLSRARRVVENAFGILANRFRILRKSIELNPEKVNSIVCAVCVLHNFLISRKSRCTYAPPGTMDCEVNGVFEPGRWRQEIPPDNVFFQIDRLQAHNMSNDSKVIREEFKEFFVTSQGELNWQYKYI